MLSLPLLPVTAMYKVGPLDLDVVLMLAILVIYLFTTKYITITPLGKFPALLIIYILVVTSLNLMFGQKFSPKTDIFLRMGRYCLYLFIVFFLGNNSANYDQLMRLYRVIAYAASIYIILQTILFHGARIYLPNRIGGSIYTNVSSTMYRFRSFYSEPADLGYGLSPFIACSLFGKNYKKDPTKTNYMDALLVSVGIVLSTSGQGIFCIAIIWAIWILKRFFVDGIKTRDAVLILFAIVAIVVLYATGILEYALNRADSTGEGSAVDARASGYVTLSLLSPLQKIFGAGFGNFVVENNFNLEIYYNSANYSTIAEFLFTLGIIGTIIWVLFFIYLFQKSTVCGRVLILAILFLSVLGCPMTGKHFPMWLTLICSQMPIGIFKPEL